jgi:hypothetical protein
MSENNRVAELVECGAGKLPSLKAGIIDPLTLRSFKRILMNHFREKKVDDDEDRIFKMMSCCRDPNQEDWFENNIDTLKKMSFSAFFDEFSKNFRDKDWEEKLRIQLINSKLGKDENFFNWAIACQTRNSLLKGTASFHSDDALIRLLQANIDEDLRAKSKGCATTSFKEWLDAVSVVDEDRARDRKAVRDLINAESRKRPASAVLSGPSRKANTIQTSGSYSNKSGATSSSSAAHAVLPKLTDAEKKLLQEHAGCNKCRTFYAGHWSRNCPSDFPDAATYKPLTAEAAEAAKRKKEGKGKGFKTVNAVAEAESESDEGDGVAVSVNAVLSPLPALVSDSEDSVSAPLKVPHIFWSCNVLTPNDDTVLVKALIDDGAHLVLIHPDLVKRLSLRTFNLPRPERVEVAMDSDSKKQTFSLCSFVKLRCSTVDGSWTSSPVRALIAPHLCSPLVLGQPFLFVNRIVVDYYDRLVIDKRCNVNLLNPSVKPPVPWCDPKPAKRKKRMPKPKQDRIDQLKKTLQNRTVLMDELKSVCALRKKKLGDDIESKFEINPLTAIQDRIAALAALDAMDKTERELKEEFRPIFEPIPHVRDLPTDIVARIKLKDAHRTIASRTYSCPRKFREAWQTLIQQHLDSGKIRPSSSAHASPSFIIPKADTTVLPRWVNDYRQLNANTVTDSHPLPRIDDILADCAKGKIWATIDMTNSFFQTRMHPDDIPLTAVTTPFGLYEWLVMPMGLRNAPAIHQRRVMGALRQLIGKICHVYLDDIVIWSQTLEEHKHNIRLVLQALKDARLYVNPKKTKLFQHEIIFLGHRISQRGIEADNSKINKILDWPVPKSAKEMRAFLGVVRFIANFLPNLAEHTRILNELTTKEAEKNFPEWDSACQWAFDSIKRLVVDRECLTTIDHQNPGDNKIFVTTDASDYRTGAVLSFGPTWETARPVAFDSMPLRGAELNYPVHEKELLGIVRALKKWRPDLLGSSFTVITDHRTLENFGTQKDLSRRQARWMEFMSQFDAKIVYVKGEHNTAADGLSRIPLTDSSSLACEQAMGAGEAFCGAILPTTILHTENTDALRAATGLSLRDDLPMETAAAILNVSTDNELLMKIRDGYDCDPWCKKLTSAATGSSLVRRVDGLWFMGDRLVVPRVPEIRETLFRLAHDTLGHFGAEKSYSALRDSYYWPGMRSDIERGYVPSCLDCQRLKGSTSKKAGPLHPLPIPDGRGDSVAIDFIGPLPTDEGYDCIVTMTDRLNSDFQIRPCKSTMTAEEFAEIFFDAWFCENGLPLEIITDRDKLFISRFWKRLHQLTGVKIKMSTAYHPQTDGASERTNKTVNQCLRFHVRRNQKGWVRALPRVRFDIMNTVNASTGYSPFQLKTGRSPRLMPPFVVTEAMDEDIERALNSLQRLEQDLSEAKDNMAQAKVAQAFYANAHRGPEPTFKVGDKVKLSTLHRRTEYKKKGEHRVAKFMPRFEVYTITKCHPEFSTYTLDLPPSSRIDPTFHASELLPFHENDDDAYPSRKFARPGPVLNEDGVEEYVVDKILDSRRRGRGWSYYVSWKGYGPEDNLWLPRAQLVDCEALDRWEEEHPEERA